MSPEHKEALEHFAEDAALFDAEAARLSGQRCTLTPETETGIPELTLAFEDGTELTLWPHSESELLVHLLAPNGMAPYRELTLGMQPETIMAIQARIANETDRGGA